MKPRHLPALLCFSGTCLAARAPALSAPNFSETIQVLERGVRDGAFPGAAIAVGTTTEVLLCESAGWLDDSHDERAVPETIWDLASLTKVIGTTAVVLTLVRDGIVSLDDPIARYLSGYIEAASSAEERSWRDRATLRHLLTHSSGLPAWKPFFRDSKNLEAIVEKIIATPLERAPGSRTVYSDLGFILLGEIASRAGGKPLAALETERVFGPLGMRHTTRAVPEAWYPFTAPTERAGADAPFLRGTVHDENARAAGGLTGHAGLFSTAPDLAVLAAEWLRALRGESAIFPAELAREFTTRANLVEGSSRALGWDTPSGESSAGTLFSRSSFGHTGFTGTSIWIDPEREVFVILLSNRVHPTRENHRINAVRPAVADAVARALDAWRGRS